MTKNSGGSVYGYLEVLRIGDLDGSGDDRRPLAFEQIRRREQLRVSVRILYRIGHIIRRRILTAACTQHSAIGQQHCR